VSGYLGSDLESFSYFLGLAHWTPLASQGELRYSWANDYGSPIDQSMRCGFSLTGANYVVNFSDCVQLIGSVAPGLVGQHNGAPFSTYDRDNDTSGTNNCAAIYSDSPWWYTNCWSGSINGGGEESATGFFNGAYWAGAANFWGNDSGGGAGNGWIFVR
jgi:hypothetical protein